MIEGWSQKTRPAICGPSQQESPILVMSVGVAYNSIQHEVFCESTFVGVRSFLSARTVEHRPDVLHRVTRLMEPCLWIIIRNVFAQPLITVREFPAAASDGLRRRTAVVSEYRQFYLAVRNAQMVRYFGDNLFRPVLSRVCLRIFEKPIRSVVRPAIPELRFASHLLRLKYPALVHFDDRVRRLGRGYGHDTSPRSDRERSCR